MIELILFNELSLFCGISKLELVHEPIPKYIRLDDPVHFLGSSLYR